NQKSLFLNLPSPGLGFQGSKVIIKNKSPGIRRVLLAAGAHVARAEITSGIKGRLGRAENVFELAFPGSLVAVRRNQHPFPNEGIETTMRRCCRLDSIHRVARIQAAMPVKASDPLHRRQHRRKHLALYLWIVRKLRLQST